MEQKPLNEWLIDKLMSPSDLARAAGVDRSLISVIMTGKRTSAKLSTVRKISEALGVAPSQVTELAAIIEGKETALTSLTPNRAA